MILVLLHYTVGADEIATHRPAHLDWLRAGLAAGMLLAAGRRQPVTGGMLLARGTIEAVTRWCGSDPFALAGVGTYEFVEIGVTVTAPGLDALAG